MEEKKLFLLDAYALIYRAYYAMMRSPRITSTGVNTSAIFGFVNTLDDLIRKEKPGYLAVCFDPAHGKTFRHEVYTEYKAGRDKQPEDITIAIPYIKNILEAMRIPVIELEGYEADDIIGTLSRKASEEGFVTYMMTPDKDYGQLVRDNVFMYRPALGGQGFEIRGPEQVCEKYGIQSPLQVIDLLALEGDASDNVPGCPGVGEKTAVKLINEFGSVENLLASTDKLKGAIQKKVSENIEQIKLSKWLVTINTDVPIEFTPEELKRQEPDIEKLRAIYSELEFKSFLLKLGSSTSTPSPPPTKSATPSMPDNLFDFADNQEQSNIKGDFTAPSATPTILSDAESISAFISEAQKANLVAMSVDSIGAEAMTATAFGIAFAFEISSGERQEAYIQFTENTLFESPTTSLIQPLFADKSVTIIGDDIKRDMIILRRMDIRFDGAKWFDIAVAHYLCNPETKHDMATIAMNYLGFQTYDYADSSTTKKRRERTPEDVAHAIETASLALRLKPLLEDELSQKGQTKLLTDIELPLINVLADMEWEGARIDVNELKSLAGSLSERISTLEDEAFQIAGHTFNVSSPSQVGNILFDEMGIDPKARKTKNGAWSTAEDVLEKYANSVPLVGIILKIRALKKLLTTYVDSLPRLINPSTGKIHTTYNQTVTSTGRISSTNPNLQNIPIRSDDGRDIRRAFIPDNGCLILAADYSQIELRLMADLSGDKDMISAFTSGEDFHRATAAKIYHIQPEEVSDTQRRNAKTANFGIIYGISPFGLSERLGIPRPEAKELIENYLSSYPGVAEYIQHSIEQARIDGYVSTIKGRKRYLPDINSRANTVRSYAERNAVNAPLQGSAADIIKIAMINIHSLLKQRQLKSTMILQVHDELVFNVIPDEVDILKDIVIEQMQNAYHGKVPMEVATGVANNWLEAH